jgi:hypothetical protein
MNSAVSPRSIIGALRLRGITNFDALTDFRMQDDGEGPYLAYWNTDLLGAQPTEEELADGSLAYAKSHKRTQLILAFDAEYEGIWSIDGEVIEAMRDRILFKAPANRTAADNNKLSQAAQLMDSLQEKLAEVRNATTEEQVDAIVW